MQTPVRSTLDVHVLIAKSVALNVAVAAEVAKAQALMWRSCELLMTAYPGVVPIAGGSQEEEQDPGTISAAILAKLDDGRLPRTRPSQVWATRGNGEPCDGCDQPIPPRAMTYDAQITSLDVYHFHAICFQIWSGERARYLP